MLSLPTMSLYSLYCVTWDCFNIAQVCFENKNTLSEVLRHEDKSIEQQLIIPQTSHVILSLLSKEKWFLKHCQSYQSLVLAVEPNSQTCFTTTPTPPSQSLHLTPASHKHIRVERLDLISPLKQLHDPMAPSCIHAAWHQVQSNFFFSVCVWERVN